MLDKMSQNLRDWAFKTDIKYYCDLWRAKTKHNIQERQINARKAFVYFSLAVYKDLMNKKMAIVKSMPMKWKLSKNNFSSLKTFREQNQAVLANPMNKPRGSVIGGINFMSRSKLLESTLKAKKNTKKSKQR